MFTGIVEEVGRVREIVRLDSSAQVSIAATTVLEGTNLGDSIAVNGVCLTVTAMDAGGFRADAMPETLARTTLGSLRASDEVNLERALLPTTRLGGHIVSGHIDGVARIASVRTDGSAHVMSIDAPSEMLRYIVQKGSIALNGISLTVAAVAHDSFTVSIIPHSFAHTTLHNLTVGSRVNIECDIVGKYVERLITFEDASETEDKAEQDAQRLSLEMLVRAGF